MATIKIKGDTSGEISLTVPGVAGTNTLTLPAGTGNILTDAAVTNNGIYLGGTTSSHLLNDYEEGTWTPTLTSGATELTNEVGAYRKIGDMVYLQMYVSLSGITGEVTLVGLPFTPNDVYNTSQVENTNTIFSENGHCLWSVYSGNSIHIHTGVDDILSNGNTTQPTSGNWRGSIWYRATA